MVVRTKESRKPPKEMTVMELIDEWDFCRQNLDFEYSEAIRLLLARKGIELIKGSNYLAVVSIHFKMFIPRDNENNLNFMDGEYSNPKVLKWKFPINR